MSPPELLTEQVSSVASGGAERRHVEHHEIPGCWEDWGWSKRLEGPVWFTREFAWKEDGPALIRFDGVSYFCHIWLNGVLIGSHRGIWDSFEVDATQAMSRGANVLAVEVFKPWKRLFPVQQSLAGFIPYVTSSFGGIWQRVTVSRRKTVRIVDLYAYYVRDVDVIRVEIRIDAELGTDLGTDLGVNTAATVRARIGDAERTIHLDKLSGQNEVRIELPGEGLAHWSPDSPVLHTLTVVVECGGVSETVDRRIGLRTLETRGRRLFFNDEPIYLRGVLHWMSYTDSIPPYWDPERHSFEMEYIRSLGFNLVKQCLVIPTAEYLDHADRTGMLIWIELPMWLPQVDESFKERALIEYISIVKQLRNHPCIVLWTLGCELDAAADGEFLTSLYAAVKRLIPGSPLLSDNSGSAEAYGGVELEISDFYDYHFYAEANHFTSLLDHFLPGWRTEKPLLFGEYCDSDTLRNVDEERTEADGDKLWWTSHDEDINPQGVRWEMSVLEHGGKIGGVSLLHPWRESIEMSWRRTAEYRKLILERTRLDPRISGYVITNIIDTPLSTAGLLDIHGGPKFTAADFQPVNSDVVLLLERDRRRVWVHGGDRPQHVDMYNIAQGESNRFKIIASNYSTRPIHGTLMVQFAVPSEGNRTVQTGQAEVSLSPGEVKKIGSVSFMAPVKAGVYAVRLSVHLETGTGTEAHNAWELWSFPSTEESTDEPRGAADAQSENVAVRTSLDDDVVDRYRRGLKTLVIVEQAAPPVAVPSPFWREGVPFIDDVSVFSQLPHSGFAGSQFLAVTPDLAIDIGEADRIAGDDGRSIVHRVDARTLDETSYWMEWGVGATLLIVTTFRLFGGSGKQPTGSANVIGNYLYRAALQTLGQ